MGSPFSSQYVRESKRGEKESSQDFSLRSTKFCQSEFVGPRTKVYQLDEGYTWVPKRRISSNIQRKRFREIEFFEIMRCSRDLLQFFYALRSRNSSYFGLFSTLRVVWLCFFFFPKGLFGKNFGLWKCYTVLALRNVQILGLIFDWKKQGILASVLHVNYSCICKLDVGFLIT